jgi:hypothetical protein
MANKKDGSSKKTSGPRKANRKKTSAFGRLMPAFSHPMLLVNLDDDCLTRTVYVGKTDPMVDPTNFKKYPVKGWSFVPIDIDPDPVRKRRTRKPARN